MNPNQPQFLPPNGVPYDQLNQGGFVGAPPSRLGMLQPSPFGAFPPAPHPMMHGPPMPMMPPHGGPVGFHPLGVASVPMPAAAGHVHHRSTSTRHLDVANALKESSSAAGGSSENITAESKLPSFLSVSDDRKTVLCSKPGAEQFVEAQDVLETKSSYKYHENVHRTIASCPGALVWIAAAGTIRLADASNRSTKTLCACVAKGESAELLDADVCVREEGVFSWAAVRSDNQLLVGAWPFKAGKDAFVDRRVSLAGIRRVAFSPHSPDVLFALAPNSLHVITVSRLPAGSSDAESLHEHQIYRPPEGTTIVSAAFCPCPYNAGPFACREALVIGLAHGDLVLWNFVTKEHATLPLSVHSGAASKQLFWAFLEDQRDYIISWTGAVASLIDPHAGHGPEALLSTLVMRSGSGDEDGGEQEQVFSRADWLPRTCHVCLPFGSKSAARGVGLRGLYAVHASASGGFDWAVPLHTSDELLGVTESPGVETGAARMSLFAVSARGMHHVQVPSQQWHTGGDIKLVDTPTNPVPRRRGSSSSSTAAAAAAASGQTVSPVVDSAIGGSASVDSLAEQRRVEEQVDVPPTAGALVPDDPAIVPAAAPPAAVAAVAATAAPKAARSVSNVASDDGASSTKSPATSPAGAVPPQAIRAPIDTYADPASSVRPGSFSFPAKQSATAKPISPRHVPRALLFQPQPDSSSSGGGVGGGGPGAAAAAANVDPAVVYAKRAAAMQGRMKQVEDHIERILDAKLAQHSERLIALFTEQQQKMLVTIMHELRESQANLTAAVERNSVLTERHTGGGADVDDEEEKFDSKITQTYPLALNLVASGRFDDAFTAVLCLGHVPSVTMLCSHVDELDLVQASLLSNHVQLSLLQQLSFDLEQETSIKFNWISDILTAANLSDPLTLKHMARVLGDVLDNVNEFVRGSAPKDRNTQRTAGLILRLAANALNQSTEHAHSS